MSMFVWKNYRHILVGSRGIICLASNLFILNMSVLSVSNTKRSSSLQIIFLLLLGSWRLFLLMYAQSCFTIWTKHIRNWTPIILQNDIKLTNNHQEYIIYESEPQSLAALAGLLLPEVQVIHRKLCLDRLDHLFF